MLKITVLAVIPMAVKFVRMVRLVIFKKDTALDDDARMEDYSGF
jgi:hypothetical protein